MLYKVWDARTASGVNDIPYRLTKGRVTVFIVATYGTTFSIQLEGSCFTPRDTIQWHPIVTIDGDDTASPPTTAAVSHTYTSGSPKVLIKLRGSDEMYEFYRTNITVNTGCTLTVYLMCEE